MGKREKIGDVIRRARERKGLSADELGALCNVSRAAVYQWEAAHRIVPKNLGALSAALGLTVKYLERVNKVGERDREREGLVA